MAIDWITVVAQVLNFAVLVALLRRFLYGPILNAIEQREAAFAARVEGTEAKQAEAEQAAGRLREERKALEASRHVMLDEARREANELRDELLEEGRREVGDTRERWRSELRREEESFLLQLRHETATQIARLGRRVLGDLAGEEFESAIADSFLARLESMDEPSGMAERAIGSGELAIVHSSFEPDELLRDRIVRGVRNRFGADVGVRFRLDPDLLCGISLHINGQKLAWSVDQYLAEVEESLANVLAEAAPPTPAESPRGI